MEDAVEIDQPAPHHWRDYLRRHFVLPELAPDKITLLASLPTGLVTVPCYLSAFNSQVYTLISNHYRSQIGIG